MSILERAFDIWKQYWQRLLLAQLASIAVPALVAALVGAVTGVFDGGFFEGARTMLFNESEGGLPFWSQFFVSGTPAGILVGVLFLLLLLLTSAGNLGVLRAIVHEGRPPELHDFLQGIRVYSVRLLWVKLLVVVVFGVSLLVTFVAGLIASAIFAGWLAPLVTLVFALLGLGAVLYAEVILVVEEGVTAWQAMAESVDVVLSRWKEALSATAVVYLLNLGDGLARKLFAFMGVTGLALALLLGASVGGVVLVYLALRYIENVHREMYGREGQFAIGQ